MKYNICTLLCFISSITFAFQGINFVENVTWQEVLDKAKEEHKFILVDCYTTWCGPCKEMTKSVFSKKEVGDSVNPFYVCANFDMDKTFGKELAGKYKIKSYPTYLFFDSIGNLVHRSVGYIPSEYFIELCRNTLNPENQYITLEKKYLSGKKDTGFLKLFIDESIGKNDSLAQCALKDLLNFSNYELSVENIEYIDFATNNINDTGFTLMLVNNQKFITIIGKENYEFKIENIVTKEAYRESKKEKSKDSYKKVLQKYLPNKTAFLYTEYELNLLRKSKNWETYLPKAEKFAKDFCWNDRLRLYIIASDFLYNYNDKTVWEKALKLALRSIELANFYDNNEVASRLYAKLNDLDNAKKYAQITLLKKIEYNLDTTEIVDFISTLK